MSDNAAEHWRRLKRLYHAALDVGPEARSGFLARECGSDCALRDEVEALLAQEIPDRFAEPPDRRALADMIQAPSSAGHRVGAYRIERLLASGGMGCVYLASRADGHFEQRVAIKLMNVGPGEKALVQRFHVERQTLARLNHPNIARLLDGGETRDGRPYVVMEYVQGRPIHEYCHEEGLSTTARLELMAAVCDAVQYAHRSLVLHCDLKPGNILVTEGGVPKLVDFGVARLLRAGSGSAPLTRGAASRRFLTPEYASPELRHGEPLTTASDVYSLGVVLYELLTGQRPFNATRRGKPDPQCGSEPLRPSFAVVRAAATDMRGDQSRRSVSRRASRRPGGGATRLRRRLEGDLDTICLKALRDAPAERYSSAEQLGEDLRRHLAGLPILARRPTLGYRCTRFARRHRAPLAAAAAIVLALVGGLAATSWQARIAEREKLTAQQISHVLEDLLASADPTRSRGRELTIHELLETASAQIGSGLEARPEVEAAVRLTLGRTFAGLGEYGAAEKELRRALAIRRRVSGEDHPATADVYSEFSELAYWRHDLEAAERFCRRALEIYRGRHGRMHVTTAEAISNLGVILAARDDVAEAEPAYFEALEIRRALFGEQSSEVAESLNNVAALMSRKGDLESAGRLARQALDIRRAVLGEDHPLVAQSLANVGMNLAQRGRHDEAQRHLGEAAARMRRVLGEDHPETAIVLGLQGQSQYEAGDARGALAPLRESLAIWADAGLPDHLRALDTTATLGACLRTLERYEEAEVLLLRHYRWAEDRYGADDPRTRASADALAALYDEWGVAPEAIHDRGRHAPGPPAVGKTNP